MGSAIGAAGGGGQVGLNLLKGGLTGLGQGLQQYGSQKPQQFNFSQLQQGFQANKKPLGQGVTPNSAQSLDPFNQNNYSSGQFPWS